MTSRKLKRIKVKKNYQIFNFTFLFVILLFAFFTLNSPDAFAVFRYPVKELGFCRNLQECKLYCQIPKNTPSCWSWGKYILDTQVLGETTISDEEVARKKGVTFPIAELGNCTDVNECRTYCHQEENHDLCEAFAKKKKLLSENQGRKKEITQQILQKAENELGCSDQQSCKTFCSQKENRDKCHDFAKINNLLPLQSSSRKVESVQVLTTAKADLGCPDFDSCLQFCSQKDNISQCKTFAKKIGLQYLSENKSNTRADETNQPAENQSKNCSNDKECREYCLKHPDDCQGMEQKLNSTWSKEDKTTSFIGPSGCKTEAECKEYCQNHPDECPGYPKETKLKPQSSFGDIPKITPGKAVDNFPTDTPEINEKG